MPPPDERRPLRILSWNVLADAYVRTEWFPLSPATLLEPGARVEAVLATATRFDADVLALQEADTALVAAARARLAGWDVRWCPKAGGRPDGCLTAVRSPWRITREHRLVYTDGDPVSGHVAHLLTVATDDSKAVIANTHVRWAADNAPVAGHVGVRQIRQLVRELGIHPLAVVAMDSNDLPGGPVRHELRAAGYQLGREDIPTSLFNGTDPRALDIVAVRGASPASVDTGVPVAAPLPGPRCPSDHVPVVVDVHST